MNQGKFQYNVVLRHPLRTSINKSINMGSMVLARDSTIDILTSFIMIIILMLSVKIGSISNCRLGFYKQQSIGRRVQASMVIFFLKPILLADQEKLCLGDIVKEPSAFDHVDYYNVRLLEKSLISFMFMNVIKIVKSYLHNIFTFYSRWACTWWFQL